MKKIWNRWKKTSNALLDKEATVILGIFYWILITPFALFYKRKGDPLFVKTNLPTFWFEKKSDNINTLKMLQKQ